MAFVLKAPTGGATTQFDKVNIDVLYLSRSDSFALPEGPYLIECYDFLLSMHQISPINLVLLGFRANQHSDKMVSIEADALIKKITKLFPTTPLLLGSEGLSRTGLDTIRTVMTTEQGFVSYPVQPLPLPQTQDEDHSNTEVEETDNEEQINHDEEELPKATKVDHCHDEEVAHAEVSSCESPSMKKSKMLERTDESLNTVNRPPSTISFRCESLPSEDLLLHYASGIKPLNDPSISDMHLLRTFLFEEGQHSLVTMRGKPSQMFTTAREELNEAKNLVIAHANDYPLSDLVKDASMTVISFIGLVVLLVLSIGIAVTHKFV